MRVFITGGTGLIGSRLIARLSERRDSVVLLTRRPAEVRERFAACTLVEGDPTRPGPWMDAVNDCDAVINLAGENLFHRRWNESFKALIRDSRLRSTDHVVQALAKSPRTAAGNPRVLVNASAIGYYGPHGDEELTEDSPPGDDFLARVCVDWEKAALAGERLGLRVAVIRIGVVLAKEGGALGPLLTPFRLGLGGRIGSGRQWMSWIHRDDLVGLFLLALDNASATGPINGTAPNPVTNAEFTRALGRVLRRPTILPTPAFALRLILGEVADVVTTGQRVLPQRALALGYQFRFTNLDAALTDLLG
ncbi:MAG TPA: TIGR01777 family oxidoreductase [Gemmataceae bacterium]|nr:TIGR01777 family oxidoreductase [Gemmataceae bacterium]